MAVPSSWVISCTFFSTCTTKGAYIARLAVYCQILLRARDIRTERQTARISALELAIEARISQGRLSYLERGVIQPHDGELERIEDALDRLRKGRIAVLTTRESIRVSSAAVVT
jgi:predicted transcriptional regulator